MTALKAGQRLRLPSGRLVQVLRALARTEPVYECAYVKSNGHLFSVNWDRVSLRGDWLRKHAGETS